MSGDRKHCNGCRDDFYNGRQGVGGSKVCWNLKKARRVRRWRLAWWTAPTVPGALSEVRTNSCHHAPGRYLDYKNLPSCAVDPVRLKREAS